MISFGKNIKQVADPLNKLSIGTAAQRIAHPKAEWINFINQLRTVDTINEQKYRQLKVQLPYYVAAIFNPPIRRTENFAYTEYFILDIDHLNDKELSADYLMEKFRKDNRIVLAFKSPSNKGIKVFFKLTSKCYDAGKYSLFYRAFAQKFSMEYNLNQYIDKKTSDVCRACFYSYDLNAHYNAQAQKINISSVINFDNELEIHEVEKEIKRSLKEQANNNEDNNLKQVLPDHLLQQIRETLNPKIKEKKEKNIFVPEELNDVLADIKNGVEKHGINLQSVRNINYGKQFKFTLSRYWAEINLFYGKKGFSIIKTTKSGSNEELANIVHDIIYEVIYE
jgi:uncharacterized protein YdeI (YjbR/CyaY-like superfamily)